METIDSVQEHTWEYRVMHIFSKRIHDGYAIKPVVFDNAGNPLMYGYKVDFPIGATYQSLIDVIEDYTENLLDKSKIIYFNMDTGEFETDCPYCTGEKT